MATNLAYNCNCTAGDGGSTLADLRSELMRACGFNPAIATLSVTNRFNDWLTQSQRLLYRRYRAFQKSRYYTWSMSAGVRFYGITDNDEQTATAPCTKTLDPGKLEWVGLSRTDGRSWRPLIAGIDPVLYSTLGAGIPEFYEIRQCIEVWPAPSDNSWALRIKGEFGLLPFAVDTDTTTLNSDAVYLQALTRAKAYYQQPDASLANQDLQVLLGDLTAESHETRRYLPGEFIEPPAVLPVMK